ncbi:MAG: hypothetical protein RIG61_00860 [Deltaproteobacteria bacterium]
MKKLFTLAALGLAFYMSSASFAQDDLNVFGVQLPIEKKEVKNQINGDYISSNSKGTYNVFGVQLPLVKRNAADTETLYMAGKESDDDKDYILVFGVKVPVMRS